MNNNQGNRKKDKSTQMKAIYMAVSLSLIMIVVLITMSASLRKDSEKTLESSETEANITVEDQQAMAPHTSEEYTSVMENETDLTTTVSKETSVVESDKPTSAEPVSPSFVSPTSGNLIKGHSGDTPVFSITMNDYRLHSGVDISGAVGDDVFAVASGEVTEIWEDPMSGNCISISHGENCLSVYRNLSATIPESIAIGSKVSAGEVIGSIGESSLVEIAEDPHLHFELMIDGEYVDPTKYISISTEDTNYEG